MGFFNFKECMEKYNIPFFEKSCCVAIVGERNNGKTTNTLEPLMDMVSENCKILICRNTREQLKTATQDFNIRFAHRYQIYGSMIYKLEPEYGEDNNWLKDKRRECVGYVADLNNYHNYKSVQAKDVKFIIFDEFIQLDNITDFYPKLVNLFMTFCRFNNTSIVLIGNRDCANNELMVNWDITPKPEAPEEDEVINVVDNIWFINLGTNQFRDLYDNGKEKHIIKSLASLNATTDTYINKGGFLHDISLNVLNFKRHIKDTFDPFYLINYLEKKAAVGKYGEDKLAICISKEAVDMAINQGLKVIPVDTTGFLIDESELVEEEYSDKILRLLLYQYKKNNLFFDSFEVLEWIKKKMCFRL